MQGKRSRRASGQAGFSLAEVLVVLVVVGVLMGITWAAIDPVRSQVESGMLTVGSTLQWAQREAVARQHDVIVSFDLVGNQLVLHEDANNNGGRDEGERVRRVSVGEAVVFGRANAPARSFGSQPVSFAAGPDGMPAVTFRRNGSASAAGGAYLTSVRAAAGDSRRTRDTRAVEIVRATGRVEWFRFVGTGWKRGF
jgi:prepilin-type N-terminal cleavage/methylation domain-containing protein